MLFSIIIPLYNRPQEMDELLDSLTKQTDKGFEVLVIEDGSVKDAAAVVGKYRDLLDIHYYVKQNAGQGFARNYGFERAKGDYFVIFDSDCLIPADYFSRVRKHLETDWLDTYGGPDAAHDTFTDVQKAISYAMTSPFTTGGIRGNRKHMGPYHPRSFNMGLSRQVWEKLAGFRLTRLGEDIEYSIRIQKAGFKSGLIPEALVYHKRRTNFRQFYKQLHFFGRARINIYLHFPSELKLVHFFPAAFTVYLAFFLLSVFIPLLAGGRFLFFPAVAGIPLLAFCFLLFFHAYHKTASLKVALLAVWAALVQLTAYGLGFLQDFVKKVLLKRA